VLRRIFRQKRDKITGSWKKIHNEELHTPTCTFLQNTIRMIKSRRVRWAGYSARMGTRLMHIGFWG
jgi:hypothetical protein